MVGKPVSILVVCMGNICRSPTAEAVFRAKAEQLGIKVDIDSAGTIAYHQGESPDPRAQAAGKARGYSFKGIRSRQIQKQDFVDFDYIFAADEQNKRDLLHDCPAEFQHKISLLLSHIASDYHEIPDPYYGGDKGFDLVLDLLELSAEAILRKVCECH